MASGLTDIAIDRIFRTRDVVLIPPTPLGKGGKSKANVLTKMATAIKLHIKIKSQKNTRIIKSDCLVLEV